MKSVNAPPTANPGTHFPREKTNKPKQQGGKTPNRREHNTNNITHIPQTTDNPLPQENVAEGADVEDSFVGNHTVHILTVYDDTLEERRMRPWLKHN